VLNNGLVLMEVSSFTQDVVRGLTLILAVGFDRMRVIIGGLWQRRNRHER